MHCRVARLRIALRRQGLIQIGDDVLGAFDADGEAHDFVAGAGAGAVFTFGLKGGYEAGIKLVNSVKLFSHLANVGDTRSLIIHPASTTHRQLSDEDRAKAGAGNDVVRLSVGIEDAADIIRDLEQAMS